jgi:arylsulfatase A-like enzyme
MYVSFNAVHTPLEAKEADLKRFEGHPRQLLAAMTWSLDQNVGKITKKLEQENLLKNTLIFFLSDNGGAHNNQSSVAPLKGWKGNEFEGGHRVPFFMSWQGKILANQKYNKLTSSLDIYATSLAVANIKFPKNKPLDGVNLMQHITNQNNNAPHQMLFWRKDEDAAARIGNLKLIRLKNYGSALYNLDDNIAETKDLAKSNPSQLKDLESALKNWETKLVNPLWTEGIPWTTATFEIHKALMNNRQPKKKQP